ncbi:MAG: DMT family transporter [Nanoarchaeota archaeon]|nr:DMT family transporter [Nanoarchaeota archaeon]MBU1270076.1 DMT family transporter [Nanoarchaeota archaeon]MBU1604995.1 DMT family transporter [Nanoarchaeota archaeon]MBU2443412.1 DMT family transporter [Nanoarchaeota archaeon]
MKKGLLLVFLTAVISGVSIFLNVFGVKGINPYVFTGMKNVIVGVFLFSVILLLKNFKELKKLKMNHWNRLVLIGLVGGSIPFLLFFKGLQMSNAAQGSFIHKTMVLWVVVLSIFFLKEKLDKKIVVGALLLLAGNFLLLKIVSFDFSTGTLLVFAATVFWSFEIIISKKLLKELSGNVVAFGRMFFGAGFILLFLLFTDQTGTILSLSNAQWTWILVTSVFLIGYVMTFYNGLKLVNASTATAVLAVGSVITSILDLVFLEKILTINQVIGLILLIVGVGFFILNAETFRKIYSSFSTAKP